MYAIVSIMEIVEFMFSHYYFDNLGVSVESRWVRKQIILISLYLYLQCFLDVHPTRWMEGQISQNADLLFCLQCVRRNCCM